MKSIRFTIRRRRVLHVVSSLGIGGIQVQLGHLLSHFSPEFDHQVMTTFDRGSLAERIESMGTRTTHLNLSGAGQKEVAAGTRAAMRSLRPDIVHAHGRVIAQIGITAALREGVPLRIGHYYAPSPAWNDDVTVLNRLTRTFERSSISLFCSEAVRAGFMRNRPYLAGIASEVTPCGIDLESKPPASPKVETPGGLEKRPGRAVIGAISRIVPAKNHQMLIDAAALLRDAGHDFEIRIIGVGDIDHFLQLKERVVRNDLASRIHFEGYVEDTADALGAMDIFVLCSRREGMPISILEAWAKGVPFIGTRVPGIMDFVHHGIDGLLCAPDDPKSLAEALERLLTDRTLRSRLRQGGLGAVSGFAVAKTTEKLEDIYHDLLKQGRSSRIRMGLMGTRDSG